MGILAAIFGFASWHVIKEDRKAMIAKNKWGKIYFAFLWVVLIVCSFVVAAALASYGNPLGQWSTDY